MEPYSGKHEKLLDQQFSESVKSNATYANKELGINATDRESVITVKDKTESQMTNFNKGKIHVLNYFDCESGSNKKLLVKRIENNS